MARQKKKIMVVDDSAFMRKALTRMIHSDPAFEVVATARDGYEAIQLLMESRPDAVTLDVEMPKMNGLETLKQIRQIHPFLPVIIVSSITRVGSDLAIQCLENGAFEIVCKPESYVSMNILDISHDLITKLRAAVNLKPREVYAEPSISHTLSNDSYPVTITQRPYTEPRLFSSDTHSVITIGSSTGGPVALQKLLSVLPADFPASIVIVQHMPPGSFIYSLADRLNANSSLNVKVAEEGDILCTGHVYIAPIGKHLIIQSRKSEYLLSFSSLPKGLLHCPSVDVLFQSAGEIVGPNNISCILTGMGSDGTKGLESVYKNQGYIIAESEETCVVYGMPRSAVEAGWVHRVAPLYRIPDILTELVKAGNKIKMK